MSSPLSQMKTRRKSPFGELSSPLQPTKMARHDENSKEDPWQVLFAGATNAERCGASLFDVTGKRATCRVCSTEQNTVPCAFCRFDICDFCLRQCDRCLETFCTFCSTINYDDRYDRTFCLTCQQDERKRRALLKGESLHGISTMMTDAVPPISLRLANA